MNLLVESCVLGHGSIDVLLFYAIMKQKRTDDWKNRYNPTFFLPRDVNDVLYDGIRQLQACSYILKMKHFSFASQNLVDISLQDLLAVASLPPLFGSLLLLSQLKQMIPALNHWNMLRLVEVTC